MQEKEKTQKKKRVETAGTWAVRPVRGWEIVLERRK